MRAANSRCALRCAEACVEAVTAVMVVATVIETATVRGTSTAGKTRKRIGLMIWNIVAAETLVADSFKNTWGDLRQSFPIFI